MLKNYEKSIFEIKKNITNIGSYLVDSNKLILKSLQDCDKKKLNDAKVLIRNISKKTIEIDNSIITTLALHSPEAADLRTMISFLKITNEFLRVATNTRGFIKSYSEICQNIEPNVINDYVIPIQNSTVESLKNTLDMFDIDCIDEMQEYFNKVLVIENKIDDLYSLIESLLLKNTTKTSNFNQYHAMLRTFRKNEKIANRAVSIASLLLYGKNGGDTNLTRG